MTISIGSQQVFRFVAMIVVGLVITTPCGAVVLQADSGLSARPGDGVIGRWATNASAVAVGPNFALTTRHQGGGEGSEITFGGQSYTVAEVFDCVDGGSEVDLRLVRIMGSNGAPANLGEYVSLYTASDEAGQAAVIGGMGLGSGAEITTSSGTTYGYEWQGPASLRWGTNTIDYAEGLRPMSRSGYYSRIIVTDFDEITPGGSASAHEAALADGDSGGGLFVYSDSQWLLAGVAAYVDHSGESWFRNEYTGGADPDRNYFIRVSDYADFLLDPSRFDPWSVLAGDANWDGVVDEADYDALIDHLGQEELQEGMTWWQMGDFNNDQTVDALDYDILAGNFGLDSREGSGGGIPRQAPPLHSPEPTVFMILTIGMVGFLRKSRK